MISVRGVSKSFGRVKAVDAVGFEVGRGEVVGLLGANGAGKTTTIRMITGFLPPDQGAVRVNGHDTFAESASARRSLGYLPEAAPAYGEMGVEGYLDYRGRLFGLARRERRAAIERALGLCELSGVRKRRIGQLSRGFRQRVGLAAAILHDPPVLVLDEPTSALDPRQIRHTRSLVRDLAQHKTVLVSSHILPEVEQTCDRVVIMVRGRVKADARPGDLVASKGGAGPYFVEVRAATPAADLLRRVPGVERVQASRADASGWEAATVTPMPGAGDLREAIARTAAASGAVIRELRRQNAGLEQVFLRLMEEDDHAGAASRTAEAAA
jgi:ABC-2 type transport system ATP-binding protein